jgi:nicotinamide-nucleotide amidase
MGYTVASIITIGDELLIGQVIDTNSAWMAQELNKAGIQVIRRVAVGDEWKAIWQALDEERAQADIILITGGLGPTADDITKPLLCEYFNGKMVVDSGALENVKNIFENILKRPMIERNLKQAEVPDCCTVIPNHRGTAPGMWFEQVLSDQSKKIFVSMPGVPHEMKGMMTKDVIPKLCATFSFPYLIHRTLLTAGVGESFLAEKIKDFEAALPTHIRLAYLPNYGMVRLRLSAAGKDKVQIEQEVQQQFDQLQFLVHEFLVVDEDLTMQQVVGKLLLARHKTVATAESCTGGYIAHLLTSSPGASAYYNGSVISYSYQAKKDLLGVSHSDISQLGAVSEQVVQQMALGAKKQLKTAYAIAVSGIMGPDGGTPDKPVGSVWVAIAGETKVVTQLFHFRFDRERNIQLTALNALNLLRKLILEEQP